MNIILLFILALILVNTVPGQNYGHWETTGSLNEARMYHASVVLPNGNVLVSGGAGEYDILNSCEIYDVQTKQWTFIDSMHFPRFDHKMVLLKNGNVLAIGGQNRRSCEIFDGHKWRLTDSINVVRWYGFTVTRLKNGKIIITGGNYQFNELNDCEIFDPKIEKWKIIDSLHYARDGHTATLLNDGRLLIVGGFNGNIDLRSCEIFDPEKETWEECASLNIARSGHSAVLLSDGKVFVSGGFNGSLTYPYLRSCELYDPIKDKWILVDSLINNHARHNSLLINDSTVLISGGSWGSATWELYDIKKYKSIFSASYPVKKQDQTTHLLTDGTVLNIGGLTWTDDSTPILYPSDNCELFFPEITSINIKDNNIVPKEVKLFQNYPNPFNPRTTIRFALPKDGYVRLNIYSVNGQKVRTLIDGQVSKGYHQIVWNGTNESGQAVSGGLYVYELKTKNKRLLKKMLLVK